VTKDIMILHMLASRYEAEGHEAMAQAMRNVIQILRGEK